MNKDDIYSNEALALMIREGNTEYLPLLWEQIIGIIRKLSNNYYRNYRDLCVKYCITPDDMIQESYTVLLKAVEAYDVNKEYKLSSYINFHFLNMFQVMTGHRGKNKKDAAFYCTSLDEPIGKDEDNSTLGDILPDPTSEKGYKIIAKISYRKSLKTMLNIALVCCQVSNNK